MHKTGSNIGVRVHCTLLLGSTDNVIVCAMLTQAKSICFIVYTVYFFGDW